LALSNKVLDRAADFVASINLVGHQFRIRQNPQARMLMVQGVFQRRQQSLVFATLLVVRPMYFPKAVTAACGVSMARQRRRGRDCRAIRRQCGNDFSELGMGNLDLD